VTDPLADSLLEDLNGLRRVVRRRLRARLAEPALSGSQVELLRVVEAAPGTGVAAAARAMHLAGNSVSALVYQLVDAGYLRRETDPADRRAARLHLTPAAHRRLGAWRADRGELVGAGLAQLSAAERSTIVRALPALRRLTAVLSTVDEFADERETAEAARGRT
jgi:DNA-binding MarR family transcriptional regulator